MNVEESALILNTATATINNTELNASKWILSEALLFGEAEKVSLALKRFTYTNWFENIFDPAVAGTGYDGSYNVIYYSDDDLLPTKYSIILPQGAYSINSLSNVITELLIENGHQNIFTVNGAQFNNKAYFTFNAAHWFVYLDILSPYTVLGSSAATFFPSDKDSFIGQMVFADGTAKFNSVESIKIRSNLSWGIIDSISKSNLLQEVIPTSTIGSITQYEPQSPTWSDSLALRYGVTELNIWIEDQNGAPLPMTENWTIELAMRAYFK